MDTVQQLQRILQSVEPAAHLVEPRVLRRVIRLDRNFQGLRLQIPHGHCYTIERDQLLTFVELSELDLAPGSDLPRLVILLPRPEEDSRNPRSLATIAADYHRRLYHAGVHLELENLVARRGLDESWAKKRREELGEIEFLEIREVLLKDDLLFPAPTDIETYIEFASQYLELRYFAPHEVRLYFPALRDWEAVDRIIQQDFDHFALFERMRDLPGLLITEQEASQEVVVHTNRSPLRRRARMTSAQYRAYQTKAERVAVTGNSVKAALSHMRAMQRCPEGHEEETYAAALTELKLLTQRLQSVLQMQPEEAELWAEALRPLLQPASEGFWSNEARLLYDLQKVCLEQERGVYRLDLIGWIRSLGRRPVRRPLPLMQDALTLRHLKTIRRRISVARIDAVERARLLNLLNSVSPRVETRSRNRLRNIIEGVFDEVGLVPQNVPERVARRKVVEELLDRVVDRSYFSISDLRDSLSRNALKLSDVTSIGEVIFGDALLRADRLFDVKLDGVYRPGAVYQRWPQTISSLVFGTQSGRFLTKHLFIPFGGAYLTVVFIEHVIHSLSEMLFGSDEETATAPVAGTLESLPDSDEIPLDAAEVSFAAMSESHAAHHGTDWATVIPFVLLLGTWVSLLIHQPAFRRWNRMVLSRAWQGIRSVVIDMPATLMNSEYVKRILASREFRLFLDYILEPALVIIALSIPAMLFDYKWSWRFVLELYLGTALFLTSPLGRQVSERTVDLMIRAWHEIKINVFSAVYHWIVDLFDRMFVNLERVVYTVDEFLRFRAGDNSISQAVKLAAGVVWFVVAYFVVFVFTLLVEPQINPIKHFPVVTVSHKIILPTLPILVRELTPYLGRTQATTVVWATIWLIPGVFGFLVWELKENWRLYSANRRNRLGTETIGDHGETMLQLLRPGFHSGTLPKAFSALRREARKVSHVDANWVLRKWSAILHVEESVRHFVERELIHLLEEAGLASSCHWGVTNVRAATNRIDLDLVDRNDPGRTARVTWEYDQTVLSAKFDSDGLLEGVPAEVRSHLYVALAGIFQRAGVDLLHGDLPLQIHPHFPWETWVELWTPDSPLSPRIGGNLSDVAGSTITSTANNA